MTISTITGTPRTAARVAGFTYLFLLVTAGFAEFYVRAGITVPNDSAQTAANIIASERLFRLGVAIDLVAAPCNMIMAVALYTLLKPVNRHLALLAAFWRLAEGAVLGVIGLASLVALRLLGDGDHLGTFEPRQVRALAAVFIDAHRDAYGIGLIFFGLGSTVFSYLLYRSGYLPRALAALGVLSSLLVLACMYALIVFPGIQTIVIPACYAPIGIFEIVLGGWLLFGRLTIATPSALASPPMHA